MAEDKLTRWVKAGYPYVKEKAGLAPWVLPEHGLNRIADEVGDNGLLKVSRPLGLAEGVERLLESAPDPASVSPQAWQDAVKQWQPLSQVSSVIAAFLEVAGPVMAQCQSNKSRIDPMVICRSLAVLLFAPFIDQGRALLGELASVMDKQANDPAELIRSYAEAVCSSDIPTLEKVNQCIVEYNYWQEWASALQEQVLNCRYTSRLIGVTPPLSAGLVGLLTTLMKEGHDESRGDNPGYPGEPVIAQ